MRIARGLALGAMLGAAAFPAQAEPLRLLALGDSLTQGYGLPQDEGFVPQLERWLRNAGHDVIVINAGVSGDTLAGGLARIDWALADEPDAVMVALGGNDLLRGVDPASTRANLDGIARRVRAEGLPLLLVGIPAPGNYGPEFQQTFEAMYPELAAEHGALLYENMLQPMSEKAEEGVSFVELMQDDHIHPNADGVQAVVEGIGPIVEELLQQAQADN